VWSVWRTIIDASSGGAMGLADQFIIRLFARFSDALREVRSRFFKLVEEVPITWEAKLYQANTPFTVYMRLQDAIAGVQQRLDYFDNFLKEDFFQLYLRHVGPNVAKAGKTAN